MSDKNEVAQCLPNTAACFVDKLSAYIRARDITATTEKTYCQWIRQYIRFHHMQEPEYLGAEHVEQFLHYLAVVENVSVRTQKTALNALVFLYNQYLKQPLGTVNFTGQKFYEKYWRLYITEL